MADTTFVDHEAPTINAAWLNDVNKAVYRALGAAGVAPETAAEVLANLGLSGDEGATNLGYLIDAAGGVLRTIQSKELDQVSVMDFGAVGDGVVDDTAAINAAGLFTRTLGKSLYFPTPPSFYKVTAALALGSSSHWFGENGGNTCIRRTSGSGHVLETNGYGQLGPYLLENLKIGGSGCTGIASSPTTFVGTIAATTLTINSGLVGSLLIGDTLTGSGVTPCIVTAGAGSTWTVSVSQTVGPVAMAAGSQYTARLEMYNCNFEADLIYGLDINAIYMTAFQCSFGYYSQTAANAAFRAVRSVGNGSNNTNLNVMERCNFYDSQTGYAVEIQNGILWRFTECDWEGNVRNLSTLDVQNVLLEQCYTERVAASALSMAFAFSTARTKVVVRGGYFGSSSMVATASMFGASDTVNLLVEDADIGVTASAFAFFNTSAISHNPTNGRHHFKDCRVAGNAGDPILWMDAILEGAPVAWTPVPTGVTIGVSTITYTGTWTILNNRQVNFTIRLVPAGTTTVAATVGTSYFQLPAQFIPTAGQACAVFDESTPASLASGFVSTNGRVYLPTLSVTGKSITISGTFNY